MTFCSSCGAALDNKSGVCPKCAKSSRTSGSDARTALIAVSVVIGLGVALHLLSRPTPSEVSLAATEGTAMAPETLSTATAAERAPVNTDDSYAEASATQRCTERYPADYTMRAACARNADSGRSDFIDIWNRYLEDSAMNVALQNCYARYTEAGATDFSMTGACARNQEDGLRELNAPRN